MIEPYILGEARLPGRPEHLLEMQSLPLIDNINDALRAEAADAVLQRGEVGRRIKSRAIRLGQQQWRHGLRVAILGHRDDDCALALNRNAARAQFRNERRNERIRA